MKSLKKGIFITLEGNEGCGKSTQIPLLEQALKKRGYKVFVTQEPGGTSIGRKIRSVLLSKKSSNMNYLCETFLYMASRAQLVEEVITPKLRDGYVVLCDRWLDATVAYQGFARGVDVSFIRLLGQKATQNIVPKATLFLDLPLAVGLKRACARKNKSMDRFDSQMLSFHQKVRRGYEFIAKKDPRRFRRIKIRPSDTPADVHIKIIKELSHDLGC